MKNQIATSLKATGFLAMLLCASTLSAFAQPLGSFEGHSDIGNVKLPGSATYNAEQQTYTVAGAGYNIWFDHDEFHYVWKRLRGDFILRANAHFMGEGTDPHRKLGWMVRSSLDSSAAHVIATVHGDGLTSLQFRRSTGSETEEVRASITGTEIIQLARQGNTYTMSVAQTGDEFTNTQVTDIDLGDEVYVGLFVSSHNEDVIEEATFSNVRIVIPAAPDFRPYRDYIGSNLEVMDVETRHRKILYREPVSLQAPNWTPDGKTLIYNSNGRLFRFDLDSRTPDTLDTGFAIRNNNDHVLSFDGTHLAISHHSADDDGVSMVYVMPVEGGTPRKVTSKGPSYLHGWSPDAQFLTYTGGRDDNYDIYKIPVDGGDEIRLTDAEGLDDGPEYTPDGQYIYFNSTRSGTMQIWRMKPDGSEQEQVTDDGLNNWFPHISPDGKWIVFLSFLPDVDPSDHPFYKQVYLRLMPFEGGEPKVVAYIYGGQGTINVPSWSPDSKRIAFISNTDGIE